MITPDLLPVVALYAGLNGLILIWLAVHVVRTRIRLRVLTGDGGKPEMVRAMRGQANFVEYVPLALILLVLMAGLGAPVFVLHLFGAALTVGRVLHALHFTRAEAPRWTRSVGAILTVSVIGLGSLGLIAHALV